MTTPERTSEGKWVLYAASGQRLERWPVDARPMLDTGDYSLTSLSPDATAVTTDTLSASAAPVSMTLVTPGPGEYAPGVPLVVTKSGDAPPAQVSPIPTGQTSKGKRAR